MKRVFLIHGWEGYPDEGWQPWLKKELQNRKFKVFVPAMPDTVNPALEKWLPHLVKIAGKVSKNDFFVGHSLGCITILRFLETLKNEEKVGGVILIAGFGHDLAYLVYKRELSSFFKKPINWSKIKKHCPRFITIHSDNDPYVPLSHGHLFKEKLGAKLICRQNNKQLSGDYEIFQLPSALAALLEIIQ